MPATGRLQISAFCGAALLLAQQAAQACPGCKPVDGAPLSGVSIGFGWGVLFLLVMVAGTLGLLGKMMVASCRVLAARDRAIEAAYAAAGETA